MNILRLQLTISSFILVLFLVGCAGSTPTSDLPAQAQATPIAELASVDAVDIRLLESFPVQVQAVARGNLADGCTSLGDIGAERQGNTFFVTLTTRRDEAAACTQALVPFEKIIPIDAIGLPAGLYTVNVNGVSGRFELPIDNVPVDGSAPAPATPAGAIPAAELTSPAVLAAQAALAEQLQVSVDQVQVQNVEPTTWPDGCLGLAQPQEMCAQQLTPGYRITLEANGVTYTVRTDESGTDVRLDATAAASVPPTPSCTNRIAFIRDVSVPDGAKVAPGKTFTKTWRLRNDGTCTWQSGYTLVFDSGDQMSGPDVAPLASEVPPQQTIDVSATLTAPWEKGAYEGFWKLRSASGVTFGIGQRPFWVKIVVPSSATPPPPTVEAGGSSIMGWVWHDLCAPGPQGETSPTLPPPGCVVMSDGSIQANGVYDQGEPRIAGMEVNLGVGPCPSDGLMDVLADATGAYTIPNLKEGVYCVSIDSLAEFNLPIFIPGVWTYPVDGSGAHTVTVDGVNSVQEVNFGWDYQFAP